METRVTNQLSPHPLNDEIYGDRADSGLVESVREKGIYNPLLITYDNRIISGHRRWAAAAAVDLEAVPVVIFASQDELDIQEAIIESNRQREKTNEQIGREYAHLKRILNERSSRQGQRSDLTSVTSVTEVPPTRQAAEMLGISHQTANKAEKVVSFIDNLEAQGNEPAASELRQQLNHSVNGAYNTVRAANIQPTRQPAKPKQAAYLTVDQWANFDGQGKAAVIHAAQHETGATFNATNDNIEWARWSWNPITGCLHNCPYCYARDIANRFYEQGFTPSFVPSRLTAPVNTKQPDFSRISDPVERMGQRNVFVCSMADLFGKWVPVEWIEAVLQQIRNNQQWTFLLLSKFPVRMAEFDYPPNVWLGTSVDRQYAVDRAEKAFSKIKAVGFAGICWLSCEPMMERLTFTSLDMFDWVAMGGASRSTQTPEYRPPFDDIVHLYTQARASGCKVYQKTNLIPGMDDTQRIREYPVEK